MRKLLLLIICNLLLGHAYAQTVDKVQYRITYKTLFVNDTTSLDSTGNYLYADDEMRLDIGNKVSSFYSARKEAYRKWIDEAIKRGGEPDPTSLQPKNEQINWSIFLNYPDGKSTLFISSFYNYRIEQPLTSPSWNLCPDTCSLLGFHCGKAETYFKGRHWTVWYTEDIPIDQGPWLLGGLPGLILKASDAHRQWVFSAISTEQPGGKEALTLPRNSKKYEPITLVQFNKMRRTITTDDILQAQNKTSGIKFTIVKADGSELTPEEYNKQYKTTKPYNPIDLSE